MQKTYLPGLKFADRLLIGICRVRCYVFVASNTIEPRVGKDFSFKVPNVKVAMCEAANLQDMQARSVLDRTI